MAGMLRGPGLRTVLRTTNPIDYPIVARGLPIVRDLYNILVFGRKEAYTTTSIKSDNGQITHTGPGNSASWSALARDYDSKYGKFNKLPTGSTDSTRNIPAYNTFLGSKGATLFLTAQFSSSTAAIGTVSLLKVGQDFNAGLSLDFQHTGTELQARTWAYKGAQRTSNWATVPTGRIIQIVLTSNPLTGEKLYIDGILVASQTDFVGENTTHFNGAIYLGLYHIGIFASSNMPQPKYYFGASWGRPLNDAEVRMISANPLMLINPKREILYADVPRSSGNFFMMF